MRERKAFLSGGLTGIVLGAEAGIPASCLAGWPDAGHSAVQPVLVTALALTSLILFLIYVFHRRHTSSRTAPPVEDLPYREMGRSLEQLFDLQTLPMAKLNSEGTRILDATPALFKTLGYSKPQFLEASGPALGIFPPRARRTLESQGWNESDIRLFNRLSGDWEGCRVFHFISGVSDPPCVLAIVTGLSGNPTPESLPGFISDLLDNRTIIQ